MHLTKHSWLADIDEDKALFYMMNLIFCDEEKARENIEAQRWPSGAVCPFCKKQETVKALPSEAMMSKPSKNNLSKPTPGYDYRRQARKRLRFSVKVKVSGVTGCPAFGSVTVTRLLARPASF